MSGMTTLLPATLVSRLSCDRRGAVDDLMRPVVDDDMVETAVMLERGADATSTDSDGWSALSTATFLGRSHIVSLLRAHAGNLHSPGVREQAEAAAHVRAGDIAGGRKAPVRLYPPLQPDQWELRIALGSQGTVSGTCNRPALTIGDGRSLRPMAPETGTRPNMQSKVYARSTDGATFSVISHLRYGHDASCYETPPVNDLLDLTKHCEVTLLATGNGAGGEAGVAHVCCDWMVFPVPSPYRVDVRFDVQMAQLGTAASRAEQDVGQAQSLRVGTARLTSAALSGFSTAHAGPTSVGHENIDHHPAEPNNALRLAGQLLLPIQHAVPSGEEGSDSGLDIVTRGHLTLRYMFVRGYAPPQAQEVGQQQGQQQGEPAAADRGAPAGNSSGRGGWEAVSSPSVDYWTGAPRTRLVGHRGAGADNSALALAPEASPPVAPASPPLRPNSIVSQVTPAAPAAPLTRAVSAGSSGSLVSAGSGDVKEGEEVAGSESLPPTASSTSTARLPSPLQLHPSPPPSAPMLPQPQPSPTGSGTTNVTAFSGGSGSVAGGRRVRRVHVPENTLLSLSTAAVTGAEFVEFDIQISRDGHPVIHHDWGVLLPGPAAARVPVTHLTLAQFRALAPQVMINDSSTSEYAQARAADAAALRRLVVETHDHVRGVAAPQAAGTAGAAATTSPTTTAIASSSSSDTPPQKPTVLRLVTGSSAVDDSAPNAPGKPPPGRPRSLSHSRSRSTDAIRAPAASGAGSLQPPRSSMLQPAPPSPSAAALSFYYGLRDTFCSLAEALRSVPAHCGFNLELKYPTAAEAGMFGLRPWERGAFVDRVLDVIVADEEAAAAAGREPRRLMFSSFCPDVCLQLARKQARYPVFLLTEGGTHDAPYFDWRWNSLGAAVAFARGAGLMGVVTEATPILQCPSLIRVVQQEAGLVLATYGRANNDAAAVVRQQRLGIGAVICDHVAHVARTLRATQTGSPPEAVVTVAAIRDGAQTVVS